MRDERFTGKTNLDIRLALKNNGIAQWELAEKIGIAEATFSRKLRYELSKDEKNDLFTLIDTIKKERG